MTNDTTPAPIGADALIDELEYAILGAQHSGNLDRVRAAKAAIRAALASAAQPAPLPAHQRALKDVALLADILNRRPALNAGLRDEYTHWTTEVYALMGAMASEPAPNTAPAPTTVEGPSWESLHHAWMRVGADIAGLDWGAFTHAVHYAPTTQAVPSAEPLVRYCPGCGSVGPVEGTYLDCCPDGNEARMIPHALAQNCRDTFKLALDGLLVQQLPAQRDALTGALEAALDAALDFAGTVAGGASWWEDVWAAHEAAIDAARAAKEGGPNAR